MPLLLLLALEECVLASPLTAASVLRVLGTKHVIAWASEMIAVRIDLEDS
jgi:hypothetical protein